MKPSNAVRLVRPAPVEDERGYRAADDTFVQCVEARDRLMLPPDAYLRLPWPSVDALVGGIAPGDVWFVAGFSGNGKTTWLMNLVNILLMLGRTVYYLGLETRPDVLRTHLACLRLGLYPGDILSGECKTWEAWPQIRPLLVQEFESARRLGERDRFLINGVKRVDERALRDAGQDAALDKADLVVIDHVDHLRHDGGRSPHEESMRAVHLILELAQDKGLRMLVATQCNNEAVKGDRLGQYQPPQPHHVYMGSHKRMIATGMLGLYRPIAADASKEVMAEVRAGRKEARDILEPNTMGISVLKHRYYGSREGMRTALHLKQGKLEEIAERDRYGTTWGSTP
jgi:KaiC/GvpD/RAD55 family RecA-like ATPase